MKEMHEPGLTCPFCGSDKVNINRNASKEFRVMCSKCHAHTGWHTKTQAVIKWYTMGHQYWRNQGKLS